MDVPLSIGASNETFIVILAAFVFVFIISLRLLRRNVSARGTRKGARRIVIFGPSNAGKTALFCQLVYGFAPECVTSTKENEGTIIFEKLASKEEEKERGEMKETKIEELGEVVDLPGHPRLRARKLARFLPQASALIFVVDGSAGLGGKAIGEAGECLHILISLLRTLDPPEPLPLFIYISKSDLSISSSSHNPSIIIQRFRSALERELERRRLAGIGGVHSTSSAGANATVGVGAKLEGLEDISLARNQSLVSTIKKWLVGGTAEVKKGALPEDENEILANEDLSVGVGIDGAEFQFKQLEGLVELVWAMGSTEGGDVNSELKSWIRTV